MLIVAALVALALAIGAGVTGQFRRRDATDAPSAIDTAPAQSTSRGTWKRVAPVTPPGSNCSSAAARTIVQLGPRAVVPKELHESIMGLIAANRCHEHRYFSYSSARQYIRQHYLSPVVERFDSLQNHTQRWAYFCALFVYQQGAICVPLSFAGAVPADFRFDDGQLHMRALLPSRSDRVVVAGSRRCSRLLRCCQPLQGAFGLSDAATQPAARNSSTWASECYALPGSSSVQLREEGAEEQGVLEDLYIRAATRRPSVVAAAADVAAMAQCLRTAMAQRAAVRDLRDEVLLAVPRVSANSTGEAVPASVSIPRFVVQMGESEVVPQRAYHALMALRAANPEYTFAYFTEATARDWLQIVAGRRWARAFDSISALATRRLLFYLVFLVLRGGVAIDAEIVMKGAALRDVIEPTATLVVARDRVGTVAGCFLASTSNQTAIRDALQILMRRIDLSGANSSAIALAELVSDGEPARRRTILPASPSCTWYRVDDAPLALLGSTVCDFAGSFPPA